MYNIYVVLPGDTIDSITSKYNISKQQLYEINKFLSNTELIVGQKIIVPSLSTENFDYYTVKRGDSLYNIAQKYNLSLEELASLNGLNIDHYLHEGQILIVPSQGIKFLITRENDTIETLSQSLNKNIESVMLQNPKIYLVPGQLIIYRES